jgi:isopenicillin N synthase-like dioxygenase
MALGQSETALDQHFERPTTWLRLLHYSPQPVDAPRDQFGSAPHTDYGCFTILAQDELGGLEVRTRSGQWIDATPLPDSFVVNVADMLSLWSGGRWPSTPHRVVNRSGHERFSVPYFFDMDLDTRVSPLRAALEDDRDSSEIANAQKQVRYGDYVMERLDRNYRYRKQNST